MTIEIQLLTVPKRKHHRPLGSVGPSGEGQLSVDASAAREVVLRSWRAGQTYFPCLTGPTRDLSVDSRGVYPESFTAMIVADLLMGQPEHRFVVQSVLEMLRRELTSDALFHFFKEHERLPADADCTALGLSVLLRGGAPVGDEAHLALDRMLANTSREGVIETYFDPTGERSGLIDPVVCANTLFLAHMLGRTEAMGPTLRHVHDVLVHRAFVDGTRYYHSPDAFLYFTARLVRRFPQTHELLLEPLRDAVGERQGSSGFPLDIAQRVIISNWLGMDDGGESEVLAGMQGADGAWPRDSLFRYGRREIYFGSDVLTTAFALRALQAYL